MTTVTPTPTISKAALRALTELTGEPRLNVALLIALKDAIEHRSQKIDEAIDEFEEKYGMSFAQFQAQGEEGIIPDQFSYEVESDYLEWDGLISRKKKLQKIGQWLI
jgi:hypothetical protein